MKVQHKKALARKKDLDEQFEEDLSFLTEDSDYYRLQDELKARRVKYQKLIDDMLLKREYLLDYLERNRRTLSLAMRDIELFKQLLHHIEKVHDVNPQSRYYRVFNEHLVANPDVATKVQIAMERMVEELRERHAQEAKDAVRAERKQQAMAVVEAAYNKIYHGMHGDLGLTQRKQEEERQKKYTINSDGEEVEEIVRVDPLTRFKEGLA